MFRRASSALSPALHGCLLLAILAWLPLPQPAGWHLDQAQATTAATGERLDFDELWDFDHPDSTEWRMRELLPAARQADEHSYLAQLLTQIARAQGLQRDFAAAHLTLDEAETLLTDETPLARVRYFLERGRVYNSARQPDLARPLFAEALTEARDAAADFYAVDAAHMLGIVEPPATALQWNLRAIEIAEQSTDPRAQGWLGSLYNNTGWSLHDLEQYEQALDIFQRALAWRQQQAKEPEIRIAGWCVARTLRSLNRVDEALAMQRQLLAELTALGEQDGYVFEELGECLLALDQAAEARKYFTLAHANLSEDPWLVEAEPERLERLLKLGGGE